MFKNKSRESLVAIIVPLFVSLRTCLARSSSAFNFYDRLVDPPTWNLSTFLGQAWTVERRGVKKFTALDWPAVEVWRHQVPCGPAVDVWGQVVPCVFWLHAGDHRLLTKGECSIPTFPLLHCNLNLYINLLGASEEHLSSKQTSTKFSIFISLQRASIERLMQPSKISQAHERLNLCKNCDWVSASFLTSSFAYISPTFFTCLGVVNVCFRVLRDGIVNVFLSERDQNFQL